MNIEDFKSGEPSTLRSALPSRLSTDSDVAAHLAALVERDPRLLPVVQRAGPVAARVTEPGFRGLARVICGQQLSVASARAIWTRFEALPGTADAQSYLQLSEEEVRATGFSGGKFRTLRVVAEAIASGTLDFSHLETLPAASAVAYLSAHKGIGPWTAEIYLMFCATHPDVFPSGDLALQKAVAQAFLLPERPTAKALAEIAQGWAPHRSTAALLFWRYFAALKDREGIAL